MVNRIPQIFPKKATELHTIKKGASPFFQDGKEWVSNQYTRAGGIIPNPNPFLVLGL
jgi:hypothetical protein